MGASHAKAQSRRPPLTPVRAAAKIKTRVLRANPRASSRGLEVRDLIPLIVSSIEVLSKHGDPAHPDESYLVIRQAAEAMAALYGSPECQAFLRRSPAFIKEMLALAENAVGLLAQAR